MVRFTRRTLIAVLVFFVLFMSVPSVIGETQAEWNEVASPDGFSFMLPPGWTYEQLQLNGQSVHSMKSEEYPNASFVLTFSNPTGSETGNEEAFIIGLDLFMKAASITAIEGYEPTYVDGSASAFGTDADNMTVNVVFVPGNERNIEVMGLYKQLDEAVQAEDTLREIALSVTFDKNS